MNFALGPASGPKRPFFFIQEPSLTSFAEYQATLKKLGVNVHLDTLPLELPNPIRFDLDVVHKHYNRDAVMRFFRVLRLADTLLKPFSNTFYGKISPVHFFWGSFDLAVTRFSGRHAPRHEGRDAVQAEAYSHEISSAGFWPGNGGYGQAAFDSYAAPVPEGLSQTHLLRQAASTPPWASSS